MRPGSIAGRLLLASALLLPLFLGVSGYGLDRAFGRAMREAEFDRLRLQSYLLLSDAELEDARLVLPPALTEPRYDRPGSGLYARFDDGRGGVLWRSPSAALVDLPAPAPPLESGASRLSEDAIGAERHFHYRFGLIWEVDEGGEVPLQLSIWQTQAPYLAALAGYRATLLRWLGVAALLLLALQWLILRWGLDPLRRLAADLRRVEAGEVESLSGDYPAEVRGVTRNLNQLLASERGRRERYRHTLADLAHSLKTPLAVLRAALESERELGALRSSCQTELSRMEEIVAHQLARATRSGSRPTSGRTPVAAVAGRLATALGKVQRERAISFDLDVPEDLRFRGDEDDLMEMLGNLLDNAFKHARSTVRCSARGEAESLLLRVADDGPGVPPEARDRILQRGARADRAAPGQGIGLAVAMEIAASYEGELRLAQGRDGAEFELRLPRAVTRR